MVSLVLYAYSTDERSSRGMERRCRQDIAYRVITGNVVPDHATIARFIRRHQQSLNELFGSVLRLCAKAGLVDCGVVAVDGTKLTVSASSDGAGPLYSPDAPGGLRAAATRALDALQPAFHW